MEDGDDRLAQLCQVSLLPSSPALAAAVAPAAIALHRCRSSPSAISPCIFIVSQPCLLYLHASQVQIFFSLLASVALKFDEATIATRGSNWDILLSVLTFAPILMAAFLESGLAERFCGPKEEDKEEEEGDDARGGDPATVSATQIPAMDADSMPSGEAAQAQSAAEVSEVQIDVGGA